jgi:hypothetical protein
LTWSSEAPENYSGGGDAASLLSGLLGDGQLHFQLRPVGQGANGELALRDARVTLSYRRGRSGSVLDDACASLRTQTCSTAPRN